jgi:hypothetical protein
MSARIDGKIIPKRVSKGPQTPYPRASKHDYPWLKCMVGRFTKIWIGLCQEKEKSSAITGIEGEFLRGDYLLDAVTKHIPQVVRDYERTRGKPLTGRILYDRNRLQFYNNPLRYGERFGVSKTEHYTTDPRLKLYIHAVKALLDSRQMAPYTDQQIIACFNGANIPFCWTP